MTAYDEIIGGPGGGKAAGIDPLLQQQDALETGVGKEQAGIAPELRQNKAVAVSPATSVAVTIPQVSIQNTKKPALAGPPPQPKTMTYAEMITRLSPYAPPSQEELKNERKREKREKLWSAIGDGLAAVTDLAFAGSTGMSNYDQKNSMSARTEARWDKLRKEREDNSQRWLALYMNARAHDDQADRWKKDFEYRAQKEKERAEEESRRWKETFDYTKEKDEKELDLKAKTAAQSAAVNDAHIRAYNAQANASNALAGQRRAAATNRPSKDKYTLSIGDETLAYPSVTDYNRAVEAYADYYGIDLYTYEGTGRRQKQKRKPIAQIAAEVEKASGATRKGTTTNPDDEWDGVQDDGSEWDGVK